MGAGAGERQQFGTTTAAQMLATKEQYRRRANSKAVLRIRSPSFLPALDLLPRLLVDRIVDRNHRAHVRLMSLKSFALHRRKEHLL